ncbi:formate transporter FocA [Neisseria sp. Ec49-e6-T10]|uniref:formate transporter FocA n=1 Tax=Neisseria sp. Ec49-e6-T10 TaxID=3140744 RepID=UPI003EBCF429
MSSPAPQDNVTMLSPVDTAKLADNAFCYKAQKKLFSCLVSSIIAGVFISIAFAFYTTVTTGSATMPYGMAKLVGGICFSLGLTLVVICGVDLFTSTILTSVPKATGKISWTCMFKNWFFVYVGNFIGALIFVAIIWFAGQHMSANGQWGVNILNISTHKLHHSFTEAVFLGILANLMVCLAAWMALAGKTLTDKLFVMVLPVAMFVAGGFEHSIANMFMIPMGILIKTYAQPEFWQIANISVEQYADLTIHNFMVKNLIPVTIGNIIGGLMVGLSFWCLNLKPTTKH